MKTFEELFGHSRPLFMENLQIPSDFVVMALAPHPDDFDAIGVTMRMLKENGNRIENVVVTSGASGVEDGFGNAGSADAKAALREYEQRSSCQFFGLPAGNLHFMRLVEDGNGDPLDNEGNGESMRSRILSDKPDLVFMPHWNDSNIGHQRTYAMFRQIAKREKLSLFVFLNQDPKTADMRNDLYTLFGDKMEAWKRRMLRYHQSQQHRNMKTRGHGIDDRILDMNKKAAEALGRDHEFAEVFELEKYGSRP